MTWGISAPTLQAWLFTRFSCKVLSSSEEILRLHRLPNPVVDAIERDIGFLDLSVQVIPAFLNPVFSFGSQFQFQIFINNTFDDVKVRSPEPI